MPPITLEEVQARQTELAKMIEQLASQAQQSREIQIEDCTITLHPGEHYAGAVLDENGQHQHHLVLLAARPASKLNWESAMDWARGKLIEGAGGHLPTRQELALLYANCKPHLEPTWHWSCETHEEDASYAWNCNFYYGNQHDLPKSYEGSVVAVRRV
ncbi:MAG TPA: hypothetical protein DDX06_01030 [Curvibacter sp.]|nr:hypothetical protein [Curvibacter sp.]